MPADDRAVAVIKMLNDMDALRRVLRMYPDGHPSVEGAKERIRQSAARLASEGSAALAFGPDTLLLDGEAVAMPEGGPVSRLVGLLFYLGLSSLRLTFPGACNGLARLATHLAPCHEPPGADDRVRLFSAANDFEGVELIAIDLSGIQLGGPEEARRAVARELWLELATRLKGRFEGLFGVAGVDGEDNLDPERFAEALGQRGDWRALSEGVFGELEGVLARAQPAQRDNVLEAIRGFVAAPVSLPDPERAVFTVATALRRVPEAAVPRDDGSEVVPTELLLDAIEQLLIEQLPVPESVVTLARSIIDAHASPGDPLADRVARLQPLLDPVAAAMHQLAVAAVSVPTRLDWDDPDWIAELQAATREAAVRERAVTTLRHALVLAPGTPLEARIRHRLGDELVTALELGDLATAAVLAPVIAAADNPDTRARASQETVPLAVRALESGDADQQALAIGILTSLGESALPNILERVAVSDDGSMRKALLDLVLRAGETAVPHVRRLLDDPREQIQRNAIFLLRRLNDTECQPLLKARLRAATPQVAAEILKFLITVQDPEWPALLLRELAADDEERLAAAAAVAGFVPRKDIVDRVVARLAERVGPGLQQESTLELIRAAGRLRSPSALPVLQEILKLRQWRFRFPLGPVRAEAARAVAQLEGHDARRLAYSLASSGEAGVAEAAQDGLRRSRAKERKAEP